MSLGAPDAPVGTVDAGASRNAALAQSDSPRANAASRWAPLGIALAGAALYLPGAIGNRCAASYTDSLSYIFMADVLTPWRTAADFAQQMYRDSRFPPLFPGAMGALGLGSTSVTGMHVFQAVVIALAAGLSASWARRACGSTLAAIVVGLAFLLSPLTIRAALDIGSEPLYVLLVPAVFVALAWRDEHERDAGDLLPGLLAGLALLTREVGVVLLPALLLWSVRRRSAWAAAGVAIAAVEVIGWHLLRSVDKPSVSYGDDIAFALGGGLWRILGDVPAVAGAFVRWGWFEGTSLTSNRATGIAAIVLLACAVPAWIRGLRRGDVLAVYVLLYGAIFSIWRFPPGFNVRYVMPLLVPVAILAWQSIAAVATRTHALRALAAAIVLAPAASELPFVVSRASLRIAPESAPYRMQEEFFQARTDAEAALSADVHRASAALIEAIPRAVAPDRRLCALMDAFVAQGTQRAVVRIPPPWELAVDAEWISRHCDYVYLSNFGNPGLGIEPFYPAKRLVQPVRPMIASVVDLPGNPQPAVVSALVPAGGFGGETQLVR